jgi:hypothetical protein
METKSLKWRADGRAWQAQRLGDLASRAMRLAIPIPYRCGGPIKPSVGVSRSNLMSRDTRFRPELREARYGALIFR